MGVIDVSSQSDSGSRSSSGDTGEGELIIRVQSEVHTTRQLNVSCINTQRWQVLNSEFHTESHTFSTVVQSYMLCIKNCSVILDHTLIYSLLWCSTGPQ